MSEEITIRAYVRDQINREHTFEVSSVADKSVATQVELARLMGEVFHLLSRHLADAPNDHLILQTFALAALDSDLVFDGEVD